MKKNLKIFITLFIFSFFVCFHISMAQQPQTSEEPINVSGKNFPFFDYVGIKILIPPGTIIGEYVGSNVYTAPEKFEPQEQQAIAKNLLSELEKAGYNIPKPSPLFGPDESQKPRFLIAGGLVKWSSYYHPGSSKESYVEVQWEIYDQTAKKVIYRATTNGYSKLLATAEESSVYEAIKISLRKFLSSKELVAAIESVFSPSAAADDKTNQTVFYYTSNKNLEASADKIKEAMKSSFTVKLEKPYGSGFIINPEGYAITNYHVVKDVSSFDAIFSDGKIIRGEVIKTFSDKDLALVKLSGSGYPYLPLKFTAALKIGEDVFSIGTPASLELSQIVSKGVVSALKNDFKLSDGKSANIIQTDASINAGNSGGPLIDTMGFAVGVNTYGLKPFSGGAGSLNLAILIDEAIKALGLVEAKP